MNSVGFCHVGEEMTFGETFVKEVVWHPDTEAGGVGDDHTHARVLLSA